MNHSEFRPPEPEQRLLMGPGPVNLYPSVMRAMSLPMLGQFDPQFTGFMNEVMKLYRQIYRTQNKWTLLVNGTARAGIEACLSSMISPGDRVLVPIFGRFGFLLTEIAKRCRAEVINIETEWGTVFEPEQVSKAIEDHDPRFICIVHGDTSTTMAQPLDEIGPLCREKERILYVDACATLGGMAIDVDKWCLDAVTSGLQKCLSGPPGCSPLTINDQVADLVNARKHVESGIRSEDEVDSDGPIVQSNYFDLAMLMDYWSPKRLNHHTEATSMLYAALACAQEVLREGLDSGFLRHRLASQALRRGLTAMGLELFGDERYRMDNVTGVLIPNVLGDGEQIRAQLLEDFSLEIGTSFGPLKGKIWRIGTMGYVCQKSNILCCLSSLENVLRRNGFNVTPGAGVDAAYEVYEQ